MKNRKILLAIAAVAAEILAWTFVGFVGIELVRWAVGR